MGWKCCSKLVHVQAESLPVAILSQSRVFICHVVHFIRASQFDIMGRDRKKRQRPNEQPHVSIPQMFMPQMMSMQTPSPGTPMAMQSQTLPPQEDEDSSSSDVSLETAAARKRQDKADLKQLQSGSTYFSELPKKRLQRFAQAIDPEVFDFVSTGESGVLLSM